MSSLREQLQSRPLPDDRTAQAQRTAELIAERAEGEA
jgi:hypothetical protein